MKKKKLAGILSAFLISAIALTLALTLFIQGTVEGVSASSYIELFDKELNTNREEFFDPSVVMSLPSSIKGSDDLSLIIKTSDTALIDTYQKSKPGSSFAEYSLSDEALAIKASILSEKNDLLSRLSENGIEYSVGDDYSTLLSGFEITVKARDFYSVCDIFGDDAQTIVGEVYNKCETELVENDVNFDEATGIFRTGDFLYDGKGIVVAVLDTGLDYYHSAFSLDNFHKDYEKLGLTYSEVEAVISDTVAAERLNGLTASDVYINEKVPFGFDYADNDSDVFPIQSEHGTHVSGVIAGKDDTITGVAPNAQLVEMKIFSDTESNSRTAWILSALEDCVILGVDVINMSIGTSCGFSRETDAEAVGGIYEKVREAGISLVVAASNAYNSAYGSEKNGNLPLTSNPDYATVGSPSTYEGALSIASISGVKTPYLLYKNESGKNTYIYFLESTNRVSEEKNFFEELLSGSNKSRTEFEYVTIPGVGRSADYTGIDVSGKIVLVRRGSTTFEEKAQVAEAKGALALIVYNNVSGEIKMTVGDAKIPVCSISQDDGEMLAQTESGVIHLAPTQTSGPFMSDFSSWGPTPDLGIKPEITAHGGSILSAVPGQAYDRISGTSMASPNMAGVVALLREYVKASFPEFADDPKQVASLVNCLLMSTADIVTNKNGLPYSVRKQGAGLANIIKASEASAYIVTYDKDGNAMNKSKLELGDDPSKSGVYTLSFSVRNIGVKTLSYNISAYVLTEGVSETKTSHGETTVTEMAYSLDGSLIELVKGGESGKITVNAGQTLDVTVKITLSDSDKAYLDSSFENGMYVEGFVTLDAVSEKDVDLNVPYLAFYGDWTQAPMLDLDYYATNKDELDDGIDIENKTLADAYATRPVGGIEDDFVNYLGAYYFIQDPSTKAVAANRDYISISNQVGSVHSLRFIWAGLLRNAKKVVVTVTEDATGEVIFETTENDIRKAYGDGTATIYPANIDVEFDALEHNLKNNATYTVKMQCFLDYGDGGVETNANNVFEFPLTTDFLAPAVTGCEFYTEYDQSTKKTRLFAKLAIYDNHHSMALQVGYVGIKDEEYLLTSFDKYLTPVYSEYNSTSYVIYELTDHIYDIKKNALHKNTFTVACYDYALNQAAYEIALPDEFTDLYFEEKELTLSINETYTLNPLIYPGTEWPELLTYYSTNTNVARIVNNKVIASAPGSTQIVAVDEQTNKQARFKLTVIGEGEEGFIKYDKPVADAFYLTGFDVEKAYYNVDNTERDIGVTGDSQIFSSQGAYSLSMYPSESVKLKYVLDAFFPDDTTLLFESGNEDIVSVDKDGKITANAEGFSSVSVKVLLDGEPTYYSQSITVEVKDPYILTGPSLTHYYGNGGKVEIPSTLAITEIGQYAFANFEYIPKDENDEISDESPDSMKIWYIGEKTITEVVIPYGVEKIGAYAFANLTALEKVVIPETVTLIDQGAFYGCTSLKVVEGLENVKFINQRAFESCALGGEIVFDKTIAIADYAFMGNKSITALNFSQNTQSIASFAFADCKNVSRITFAADKMKLGVYAFRGCELVKTLSINADVIPKGTFEGCLALSEVTIGKDVDIIGEYAFSGTAVTRFNVSSDNEVYSSVSASPYILNKEGTEILLAAQKYEDELIITDSKIKKIGNGAFAGSSITSINAPHITVLGDYAFANCQKLSSVSLGTLEEIGDYAFASTAIRYLPSFEKVTEIGAYAFTKTGITAVQIPDNVKIGDGAFAYCPNIQRISLGDNVNVGRRAFIHNLLDNWTYRTYRAPDGTRYYEYVFTSPLTMLTIGKNAYIGSDAFNGCVSLEAISLGEGAIIGDKAFYNAHSLTSIDLSSVKSIGDDAFSGDVYNQFLDSAMSVIAFNQDGEYIYSYFASKLTEISLDKAESIGEGAFAYSDALNKVTLGSSLTEIPDRAFMMCKSLSSINLEKVTSIGDSAFGETALTNISLDNIKVIGDNAFAYIKSLAEVNISSNEYSIGNSAFASSGLSEINLSGAKSIGNYAFAYTGITSADLTYTESLGDGAFIKESYTPFSVSLSDKLTEIGDNPFANCKLIKFSLSELLEFGDRVYEEKTFTYNISDTIRVIDGSLYKVVPNGLELITFAGDERNVSVAEGTVRISAMAFAGSDVTKVTLPRELYSIGHKAFYGCDSLAVVVFTSYTAPKLEEEYDEYYYLSRENIPGSGEYTFSTALGAEVKYTGIGIVPYFMWNADASSSNCFYGASFVDYLGHGDRSTVMVRPVNGKEYSNFTFDNYFGAVIDGSLAPDKTTLEAINAIRNLPNPVSLSDKPLVVAARAAYDKITSVEQKAVAEEYYAILTQAEKRILDLEYLEGEDDTTDTPTTPADKAPISKETVIIIALSSALLLFIVTTIVFMTLYLKKKKQKSTLSSAPADSSDDEASNDDEALTDDEASNDDENSGDEEIGTEDADTDADANADANADNDTDTDEDTDTENPPVSESTDADA